MFLNKTVWSSLVNYGKTQSNLPLLPCPFCQKMHLQLTKGSIQYAEVCNKFDLSYFKEPKPTSNAIEGLFGLLNSFNELTAKRSRFTTFFHCQDCSESVSALGEGKIYEKSTNLPFLRFTCFYPALQFFELKPVYPTQVRSEMEKSFAAFFSDPTAAGNRVRTAIEFLLDKVGVDQFRVTKEGDIRLNNEGGKIKLPLGERLKLFSESDPELGNMLGAVKALGNEATHGAELLIEDLLDAYELIEHVLEDIFVKRLLRARLLEQSNEMKNKFK